LLLRIYELIQRYQRVCPLTATMHPPR
jgi:hypothetical protein